MSLDFELYAHGVCCASVCTCLSDEETTRRLNLEHPTGISSLWHISSDSSFHSGHPNPTPCEQSPDTHRHILFNC